MRPRIKLNLRSKNLLGRIQFGKQVHKSVSGNANFPNASAYLSELLAATTELENAATDYDEALAVVKEKLTTLRMKDKTFADKMRHMSNHIESQSGFDAPKIQSAGFELKAKTGVMKKSIGIPMIKELKDINRSGCLLIRWNRVPNSYSYTVALTTDVNDSESWRVVKTVTKSKCVLEGLQSGVSYWFRIATVSALGTGAPSDPANKVAP